VKGDQISHGEFINESDTINTATDHFYPFFTKDQLTSDKFQSAARGEDEVTTERQHSAPADATLIKHVKRNVGSTGAQ
jgi:hypothetical protein